MERKTLYKRSSVISAAAALLCVSITGLLSKSAAADPPEHPHYLHALADLRVARAWITEGVGDKAAGKEADAVANIDKAMDSIKHAAIDDGKDLKEHEVIDVTNTKHAGRLRKAYELLKVANKDLHEKEGDKKDLGWRTAAIRSVEMAQRLTGQALNEMKEK